MATRQHLLRVATTAGGDSNGLAEFAAGSADCGPLIPAYTDTQRDAITTATEGMLIYNSTYDRLQVRTAISWLTVDIDDLDPKKTSKIWRQKNTPPKNIKYIENYNQFIFTFQDDYNPPILDAWVAIDESVEAGKAEHIVLGYETYKNDLKFQVQANYKNI